MIISQSVLDFLITICIIFASLYSHELILIINEEL